MKKLEQMLSKMSPRVRHYNMGGSVANEPQQWTSQQKALMGNQGKKKGYMDIISDYHTPAGSAYRFTNPSAPMPFDAEKRVKQNVAQQAKVMEEQLINTEKAGEQKAYNMVDQFQLKVLENQQRGITPNQELMEKWNTELRNENQRQPYTGRYKQADERLQHQERSSYPPQINMVLNTQKALHKAEMQKEILQREKELANVSSQMEYLGKNQLDMLKRQNIPYLDEQGAPLPFEQQQQRYAQHMNTLGESIAAQKARADRFETATQEAEGKLGGYQGWKSPNEFNALQNQYNTTAQQKAQMEQQLATLKQQMQNAPNQELFNKLKSKYELLLSHAGVFYKSLPKTTEAWNHYQGWEEAVKYQ